MVLNTSPVLMCYFIIPRFPWYDFILPHLLILLIINARRWSLAPLSSNSITTTTTTTNDVPPPFYLIVVLPPPSSLPASVIRRRQCDRNTKLVVRRPPDRRTRHRCTDDGGDAPIHEIALSLAILDVHVNAGRSLMTIAGNDDDDDDRRVDGVACMYLKNNTISSLQVRCCNGEGPWVNEII